MKKKLAFLSAMAIGGALTWRAVARSQRSIDLANRVVLISGGSRGLGLILARHLADEGCKLALLAREEEDLNTARAELEARGAQVFTTTCDVTKKSEIEGAVNQVLGHYKEIDALINCAAIFQAGPLDAMTDEDFEVAMQTNFWGAYHLTNAVLPPMRERGEGRIVNISSVGGLVATPHLAPYNASKFALAGWSQNIRTALANEGIFVTTVFPWIMNVGSLRNATFKGHHKTEYAIGTAMTGNMVSALDPEVAAQSIIEAMKRGDATLRISWRTRLAETLDKWMPELSADAMTLADKLMPGLEGEGSIGKRSAKGYESQSDAAPSIFTAGADKASQAYNETAKEARETR